MSAWFVSPLFCENYSLGAPLGKQASETSEMFVHSYEVDFLHVYKDNFVSLGFN